MKWATHYIVCTPIVLVLMIAMVARTDYHNIAGTRCPTDFVEFPSTLMEHFCSAPKVLPLFARHHITDAPLSPDILHQHIAPIHNFRSFSIQHQIMYSVLDLAYHNSLGFVDSTAICHQVFREYSLYPALPSDSKVTPQYMFTHLFPYGASYYSYLFDRAIADKVWKEVFEQDPLSREAGERFLLEVLRWGAGRDPWDCIAGVLGQEDLRGGGKEAMERVGQWGIERT
jgi:mitochondrial intermediate peptidase